MRTAAGGKSRRTAAPRRTTADAGRVAPAAPRIRVGIDIGGTFTDAVYIDERTGISGVAKVPSTPRDPAKAFLEALSRVLEVAGAGPAAVRFLAHGTTVATNTVIEGKGAPTAFVASAGFRDLFEIGRQIRPDLYDPRADKPPALIPRELAFEVAERLDADGRVLVPLDEAAVRALIPELARRRVQAVVVGFLHSYRNPAPERRAAALLAAGLPGVLVAASADVCPEFREYPRFCTAAVNGLVAPVVSRYLAGIERGLGDHGVAAPLHLMTSSGGIIAVETARLRPVHLLESGPAAGVIAATHLGRAIGARDLIAFDMGGTTAKAGLVVGGVPGAVSEFEVGGLAGGGAEAARGAGGRRGTGYPVKVPAIELVEIGAGGGSVGWVDSGGGFRVGPQSAGADPGPACYGRGGTRPTITDANLVLGRLAPDYFLGGEMPVSVAAAERALEAELGRPLGLSVRDAALGMLEIANAKMVEAIRMVSVQRGFDPRAFVLVAFGGAGPLHATAVARALGVRRILIPPAPGVSSALGLLTCDLKHDYVRSYLRPLAAADPGAIGRMLDEFAIEAGRVLAREGVAPGRVRQVRALDLRYVGQSFELTVPLPPGPPTAAGLAGLEAAFFRAHARAYGFAARGEPIEVVNVRLTAVGLVPRARRRRLGAGGRDAGTALNGARPVVLGGAAGGAARRCPVYDRYRLRAGNRVPGPAIVEQVDTTTVIEPGFVATVDPFGNLLLDRGAGR
jgi:N-methylhydantoinase A